MDNYDAHKELSNLIVKLVCLKESTTQGIKHYVAKLFFHQI
jgi:hypothetical protein